MDFAANGMDKLLVIITFVAIATLYLKNKKHSSLPYPPGPRKLPVLGNLLDVPSTFEWERYIECGKKYNSDIIHVGAAGRDIIVLNSFTAANALLDKKSAIYSNRPQAAMVNEILGWKWLFSSMEYALPWKKRRRLFQMYFSNRNVEVHQITLLEFVRQMLSKLNKSPDGFLSIIRHLTGGVALSLAYGLEIQDTNDPFVDMAQHAVQTITDASTPRALLFDLMPWLKYLLEKLPCLGFNEKTRTWRKLQEDFHEKPYAEAIKEMAKENGKLSFTSKYLQELEENIDTAIQEQVIKDTAGIVFAAGSDTTVSAIHTFFVAILHFPEVQQNAQAELDHVLGGRLPQFEDEINLPYISALVKEVLRWRPVTPGGLPHCVTEDDYYEGYYIPRESIVIGNIWAMLHNAKEYPSPSIFKPERFLGDDGKLNAAVRDPASIAFGFGRRACPGKEIAKSLLWLTVASVLATFDISKAVDKNGKPMEPSVHYQPGIIIHPPPFKCIIKPRSIGARD